MKTQLSGFYQNAALLSFYWLLPAFFLLLINSFSAVVLAQGKQWDKTLGGINSDQLSALIATADGGYLLGGSSDSDKSGNKSEDNKGYQGSTDYWVVKLKADGTKAWDKTIGGSNSDNLTTLQQTRDGGYILGGFSYSDKSGDKTENNKQTLSFSHLITG